MPALPLKARAINRALLIGVGMLLSTSLLAGCGDTLRQMRGASDKHDGAWVGQLQVSTRTNLCILTRGGIRATIQGGVVQGTVRQPGTSNKLGGLVLDDSTLDRAFIQAQYNKDSAELTGSFKGDEASGRWKSRECSGTWDMRKIR